MTITRQEVTERLTRRWHEQVAMFPRMGQDVPLALYVNANLAHVIRRRLLSTYRRPA